MSTTFEPSLPPPRRALEPTEAPSRVDFLVIPAVAFLLISLGLFIAVWMWPAHGGPWGPGTSTVMAWMAFAFHIVCCRRYLNAFDPAIWIPVLILLFYMGTPIAVDLLGSGTLREYDSWNLGIVPPRLNQAFASTLLCLVALLAGLHLAGFRNLSQGAFKLPAPTRDVYPACMALMFGGLALMIVGIAIIGPGLLFGAYSDMKFAMNFGKGDFRLWGTGQLFMQAGCFGVIAGHNEARKNYTVFAVALTVIFALLLVATGDRGGLSALVFGTGWVFHLRVRRLPMFPVVAGFVFALILVPIIGEFRFDRSLDASERRTVIELIQAALREMGSSFTVFAYTLEYIPRIKPYSLGLSFYVQLVSNIPNFGIGVAWTNTGGLSPWEYLPSTWIVYIANPTKFFEGTSGYGYTYGAEWYFNFGFPGMLLGMMFTGWLLGWLRNSSTRGPFWMVTSALYFQAVVLVVRNSVGYPLRTAVWPMIGLFVLWLLWPQKGAPRTYLPQDGYAPSEDPYGPPPGDAPTSAAPTRD